MLIPVQQFIFCQNRRPSWCYLCWLWTKPEKKGHYADLAWHFWLPFAAENVAQELSPGPGKQLDPRVCFGCCFRPHSIFWESRRLPTLNEELSLSGSVRATAHEAGRFAPLVPCSDWSVKEPLLSLQDQPSPKRYHLRKPSLFSFQSTK